MTMNRLFRLLWRFNALVVAGAGLAVMAGALIVAVTLYLDQRRDEPAVRADAPAPAAQALAFGDFSPVAGTSVVILPLEQEVGTYGFASSGGPRSVTRNLLFVDLATGTHRWLIEGGNALISRYRTIERDAPRGRKAKAIAIMAQVIDADTNGDGRLGEGDRMTVAFAKPDGTDYTAAIRDVDRLLGRQRMGGDLLVGYERQGNYNLATVRLSDFRVAATHAIEMPSK